jgi:hypothetical protein
MGGQYYPRSVFGVLSAQRSRATAPGIAIIRVFDVFDTCNSASEIVVHSSKGSNLRSLRNRARRSNPFSVISPSYTSHKSASIVHATPEILRFQSTVAGSTRQHKLSNFSSGDATTNLKFVLKLL